jgi:hypothetical protein
MSITSPTIGDAGAAADLEGSPAMLAVPQPDAIIDAGLYGPLVVRAASVRGAGHRYDGTPRQDDFCLGAGGQNNEWFVVAVADGVSAGPSSHVASRAAVRFGVKLVTDRLAQMSPSDLDWNDIVGSVAGFVLAQARNETGNQQLTARDAARVMATTIVFAVVPVYPIQSGMRRCTVVPIGDTSGWVLRAGGRWASVTDIKNADNAVAVSATAALPLLPSTGMVPLSVDLGPGDALFVLTDGVGDPLGDGTGEVGAALARAWARPPDRYQFAAQVDFRRRSHTDDRTVVAIWPDQLPVEPTVDALATPAPAPAPAALPTVTPSFVSPGAAPATTPESAQGDESTGTADAGSTGAADAGSTDSPASPGGPWEPKPWEPRPWTPT